jgi:tRNA(Arg) A34 adenosine deaminase TadA
MEGCTLDTAGEPCPMCLAAAYRVDVGRIVSAATVEDALEYGDFDDRFIFRELALPPAERRIPMQQMLRGEAVEVWEKYRGRPDRVLS